MKSTFDCLDLHKRGWLLLLIIIMMSCDSERVNKEQVDTEARLKLGSELDQWARDFELMGASILLIAKGEPILEYHYGFARIGDSTRTNTQTSYRIASISKTLSSLAILKLVEAGTLDMNADVSDYLGWSLRNPFFPDQVISLADIMSHRSGLRDGSGYGAFISAMQSEPQQMVELFTKNGQYFTDDMFANHKVGEYFSYTNCSWGIVASVVEKASGMRFDKYTKQELFEPMGMHASFNVMDIPIKNIATLYRADTAKNWVPQADDVVKTLPAERAPTNYEIGSNGLIYGPQGSLRASAADLLQFAKLLMNDGMVDGKQLLQPSTLQMLRENRWEYDGNNGDTWGNFWLSYGKGLHFITNTDSADVLFPDRVMQGHPGIAYGLLSDFYVDPQTKSGVIFITNGSKKAFDYGPTTSFYEVEERLFEILYPYLKAVEKEVN